MDEGWRLDEYKQSASPWKDALTGKPWWSFGVLGVVDVGVGAVFAVDHLQHLVPLALGLLAAFGLIGWVEGQRRAIWLTLGVVVPLWLDAYLGRNWYLAFWGPVLLVPVAALAFFGGVLIRERGKRDPSKGS